MKQLILLVFSYCFLLTQAQQLPEKQRVLFVLDASGSMEAKWGDKTRMEIATKTLYMLVDSIEKSNPDIEMALRVFGHQYHKSLNNCTDSKLEIPFGTSNALKFKETLSKIKPNGNTPIAYSLMESASDFNDDDAINSIILITDGLENCEGDPCKAAKFLSEKRISINPFIIGLDIQEDLIHSFDCIGTFINAKDENTLKAVLKNTVKQATGTTTLSIGLYTLGNQELTNTPISIIDPIENKVLFTYIHSLTRQGLPDTLYMDPRGFYQIQIHSYPPLLSDKFQLTPSTHNTINLQIPKSYLDFTHEKLYDDPQARFILKHDDSWIYNYNLEDVPLLAKEYELTTTLLPLKNEQVHMKADKVYKKAYPSNGKLSIENVMNIRASIFQRNEDGWTYVYDIGLIDTDYSMKLQSGKYCLVYVLEAESNSDNTHQYNFEISEGRTSVIKLK